MVDAIINAEWLNANSLRKYPLSEEATGRDESDSISLPDNFLVDMVMPVHSAMNLEVSKFQILQIAIFGTAITLTLGHAGEIVGTATIPAVGFERNSTFFINGIGDFANFIGKVTIGELDTILLTAGAFDFELAGGRIEASVIVPDIRGLDSLQLLDGDGFSDLIQGDVAFQAGRNIRFVISTFGGTTVLTVDAIDGEGTIADCDCDGDLATGPAIKFLNNVGPDDNGNVELRTDDCILITPLASENALSLEDECSKPCCGCPELEVLILDQERVRDQVHSLANLASEMNAVVQSMQSVVAASN